MIQQDKINETIKDIEALKDVILERHSDNISLTLRFNSVFKQLINSLNGSNVKVTEDTFNHKPLTKMFGKNINKKLNGSQPTLPKQEVDEVAIFKEKIQTIYDSFLNRENTDLLDSLEEIEIRGVAKLAGVPNFEKADVNGKFIDVVKKAIKTKADIEAKKAEELENLSKTKDAV